MHWPASSSPTKNWASVKSKPSWGPQPTRQGPKKRELSSLLRRQRRRWPPKVGPGFQPAQRRPCSESIMAKRNKIRTEFRKKHESRVRPTDLTRDFQRDDTTLDDVLQNERVSGKGSLTRKRTIVGQQTGDES